MPFERPTLSTLVQQGLADVASRTGAYAVLRTSPLAALSKAVAGLVNGLYGYLDWIARQAVPITARDEYLQDWAALVGVTIKPATRATGLALFNGTPGALLPDGTRIVRTLDGVAFTSTELVTVAADGTVWVPIQAVEPGAAGNSASGAPVVISAAVEGVIATGTAVSDITGGADDEEQEEFRSRMLARYQSPPMGGAESDYQRWALEVPGVTRAWVAPNLAGAGTVVVYIMLDVAQAGNGGFPQGGDGVASAETRGAPATGDQLAVANHIYPLRSVTALVYVVGPAPYPVDVGIADLAPNTEAARTAITQAVREAFRQRGRPGGTIYTSDLTSAIASAAGVQQFSLIWPTSSVTAPTGSLPVLGTITWS